MYCAETLGVGVNRRRFRSDNPQLYPPGGGPIGNQQDRIPFGAHRNPDRRADVRKLRCHSAHRGCLVSEGVPFRDCPGLYDGSRGIKFTRSDNVEEGDEIKINRYLLSNNIFRHCIYRLFI